LPASVVEVGVARLERHRWITAAVGLVPLATIVVSAAATGSAQTPDVASVLVAAGRYLDQYERDVTAVIAQEDYQQQVLSESRVRLLKSDLLIIADAEWGWVEFRDTFEVDSLRVRDRDERIARLFMKPDPNVLEQARRISAEGARFNLNPTGLRFNRTLNVPLTALRFLRRQNQDRSTFRVDRADASKITLKFKEQGLPRLISTQDNVAAEGVFVVDAQSGRVLSSELSVPSKFAYARFKVEYAEQPALNLWLPATMVESYIIPANPTIDGRATYSHFRAFKVETSTEIGK
jgi:hypothetical protein